MGPVKHTTFKTFTQSIQAASLPVFTDFNSISDLLCCPEFNQRHCIFPLNTLLQYKNFNLLDRRNLYRNSEPAKLEYNQTWHDSAFLLAGRKKSKQKKQIKPARTGTEGKAAGI